MSRIIFILLVAVAIFSSSFGEECGPNEVFSTCGSACAPTCAEPKARVCTMQCIIGCKCQEGFLRNGEGACVLPQNC
ncbi:chymotrypsin inhibitor [Apis florea]|uniref:chymotrypsin inhibitor n=1 Tax=Apis florea TaxID=7463 RepID=UPI000252BE3D|nr:chymotrypsin inhibitor [Apis florea]